MHRFLIFCLPRTGSTTLMRILNRHRQVSCLNEPFNRHCQPDYWRRVTDSESLSSTIQQIWQNYNGIKHVADIDGWPFSQRELNHELLRSTGCNIVFLTRRNALKRALSAEMAQQAEIWHLWSDSDSRAWRRFDFTTVDLSALSLRLKSEAQLLEAFRWILRSEGARYRELRYEDVFSSDLTRAEQLAALDEVVTFLGLPMFEARKRSRGISKLLDARSTGSDSPSAYRRIPNIDEIEAELGCDETGWLFK